MTFEMLVFINTENTKKTHHKEHGEKIVSIVQRSVGTSCAYYPGRLSRSRFFTQSTRRRRSTKNAEKKSFNVPSEHLVGRKKRINCTTFRRNVLCLLPWTTFQIAVF